MVHARVQLIMLAPIFLGVMSLCLGKPLVQNIKSVDRQENIDLGKRKRVASN